MSDINNLLQISSAALVEKNKIATDAAWLILLTVAFDGVDPVYLVANTEDITSNGQRYIAFPFVFEPPEETQTSTVPEATLKVGNETRALEAIVGTLPSVKGKVTAQIICSKYPDEIMLEYEFSIKNLKFDEHWATMTLGSPYPLSSARPERKYKKNFCDYEYCGVECGLPETIKQRYPQCQKTLKQCRERGNSIRFGGEPSIPQGGLYQ